MKLLIITQKVDKDDPILGFFHSWLEEFSNHGEKIIVICLEKGEYNLPANVEVLSLGKEFGQGRIKYLWRFYWYLWQESNNYDAVFVHMNQIYIILAAWWWRLANKKVGLWYVHKQVSLSLKLAEKLTNVVFTTSAEVFKLPSQKVIYTGHGIDIDFFKPTDNKFTDNKIHLVSVGRLSPVKEFEVLIEAAKILTDSGYSLAIDIIGGSIGDQSYENRLKQMIKDYGLETVVILRGALKQFDMKNYLKSNSIFVHTCRVGSWDKVTLEAMSMGLPVISPSEIIKPLTEPVGMYFSGDSHDLAEKIKNIIDGDIDISKIGREFRQYVVDNNSLKSLIFKIMSYYNQL